MSSQVLIAERQEVQSQSQRGGDVRTEAQGRRMPFLEVGPEPLSQRGRRPPKTEKGKEWILC